MNLFYADPANISGNQVLIKGQESKHATKVLRNKVGDRIHVTDGAGNLFIGEIRSVSKIGVIITADNIQTYQKPERKVTLALGMIKKRDRLEFAVEKAVELGISSILLFRGDHSESFNIRTDRIEATIQSAMKQSFRVFMPDFHCTESLEEGVEMLPADAKFIVADQDSKNYLSDSEKNHKDIVLVVGPEGGLSGREKNILEELNSQAIRLGDYRLRAETAAIVMAAEFGNKEKVETV